MLSRELVDITQLKTRTLQLFATQFMVGAEEKEWLALSSLDCGHYPHRLYRRAAPLGSESPVLLDDVVEFGSERLGIKHRGGRTMGARGEVLLGSYPDSTQEGPCARS